jgi:hypothetical protein
MYSSNSKAYRLVGHIAQDHTEGKHHHTNHHSHKHSQPKEGSNSKKESKHHGHSHNFELSLLTTVLSSPEAQLSILVSLMPVASAPVNVLTENLYLRNHPNSLFRPPIA